MHVRMGGVMHVDWEQVPWRGCRHLEMERQSIIACGQTARIQLEGRLTWRLAGIPAAHLGRAAHQLEHLPILEAPPGGESDCHAGGRVCAARLHLLLLLLDLHLEAHDPALQQGRGEERRAGSQRRGQQVCGWRGLKPAA